MKEYVPIREPSVIEFIYDIIKILIEDNVWLHGGVVVSITVIHTIFCPKLAKEPLHRDDTLSLRKSNTKGKIIEIIHILGWRIDRPFLIIIISKGK